MAYRRRIAALVALNVIGLSVVAAAAVGSEPDDPVLEPTSVQRVQRFYSDGPHAYYEDDVGNLGGVPALEWVTPGDGTAAAVIEISFQYRTRGQGPFYLTFGVREVGGPPVTVRPTKFSLAPAAGRQTATVRFLAPDLESGQAYAASVGVNSVAVVGSVNRVDTRKVLMTVERVPPEV